MSQTVLEPTDTLQAGEKLRALERRVAALETLVVQLLTARPTPQPDPDWWQKLALRPDADVEFHREWDEECRKIREADRQATRL